MLLKKAQSSESVGLEMTPMIDMVFLLLIFFLVATTLSQEERELEITLPAAESAAPLSVALKEIVINVDAHGDARVGGRKVERDELRGLVADAVKVNPEQKVTVRGDRRTPYDDIARVLDACKAGGVDAPFLDTVPAH
ncbi:MAG TPA: biopolymer transporter ExbD [Phycisphaerae bacterium]|nr:biopolymer transporter ExbD [Phycisphaerales bacterium]HRX83407.1 biopolymer transporter ExbD [Phycisphaerae bacterium]